MYQVNCDALYDQCYDLKDTKACNQYRRDCKEYKPDVPPKPVPGTTPPVVAGSTESTSAISSITDWFSENSKWLILGIAAIVIIKVVK